MVGWPGTGRGVGGVALAGGGGGGGGGGSTIRRAWHMPSHTHYPQLWETPQQQRSMQTHSDHTHTLMAYSSKGAVGTSSEQ